MFTGIVEEVGRIKAIKRGNGGAVLEIEAVKVLEGTRVGDSIATNGVCLTVTGMGAGSFDADVMPETLRRSNLGDLRPGDRVNLERALRLFATPAVSRVPLMMWYLVPGRSLTRPPLIRTTLCSCRLCPSPGM